MLLVRRSVIRSMDSREEDRETDKFVTAGTVTSIYVDFLLAPQEAHEGDT